MTGAIKITLAEFLSDSHINPIEESSEERSGYCDTYENKFDFIRKVAKPQEAYLEAFKESHSLFSSSQSSVKSSEGVTGRYDINWLSPDDYISNWEKLTKEEQLTFRVLVMSDFKSNSNRYGLKTKNLEAHLLLNLGCDMNNILNSPNCSIRSNLRSPGSWTKEGEFVKGDFSTVCSDNRTVDAKTCRRSVYKFKRSYDVEKLFKSGFVAYQLVIRSDSSYRKILKDDPIESKRRIHLFFRDNASYLSRLANKKKKILSYLYSHEISVDSILREEYRPHTHSIIFLKRSNPLQEQEEVELIEKEFNSLHSDREMSLERYSKDDSLVPRRASKFKDIEASVDYLFRAYSLAEGYLREIRSHNIRELNQKTVECYRNLIWLFKAEDANGLKGVRRFNSSYIPEKNDSTLYKHPLLQKKKKSNTIKKENSKPYASTRKPSQNKYPNTRKPGSAKPCKSSRVKRNCSRTGIQRRILKWNNRRVIQACGTANTADAIQPRHEPPICGRANSVSAKKSKPEHNGQPSAAATASFSARKEKNRSSLGTVREQSQSKKPKQPTIPAESAEGSSGSNQSSKSSQTSGSSTAPGYKNRFCRIQRDRIWRPKQRYRLEGAI
jgi:hypothetical protein